MVKFRHQLEGVFFGEVDIGFVEDERAFRVPAKPPEF